MKKIFILVLAVSSLAASAQININDLYNKRVESDGRLWIGILGTGFYKGTIKDGDKIQVVETSPGVVDYKKGVETKLTATIVNTDYADQKINWKSDNPSIATVDENGNVTPLKRGTSKIWATTANGRFSDYTLFVVHESPIGTGIHETNKMQLKIVPMPAKNSFSIKGINGPCNVNLFNLNGKKVLQTTNVSDIDISALPQGMYIVNVQTRNATAAIKFVKS